MVLLTQEHFVSTIEAIRMQLHKDYAYADAVSTLFNTDSIGPYDNSLLVKQLISLLQMYFPRDKEGFCDIEHYCFELNFGKCGDQELITAEDLYRRLIDKTVNHYVETFKKVEQRMVESDKPKFDPSVFGYQSIKKDASELIALWPQPHSKKVDFFNIKEACSEGYFKRASLNEHLVSTHPLIDDYPFKKDIDGEKEH